MQVVRDKRRMQQEAAQWRRLGRRIGLVPTMGALHAGHLSLVERARPGCDTLVASIFVNPLQFGPQEDFQRYPRDLARDLSLLEGAGCDWVFVPETEDMVAPDATTHVAVLALDQVLCGRSRPGHFRGVATIVTKLFHVVQPHVAVFGQKDAQQVLLLQRLARDLDFDVEIRVAPIVREADGLAMSSRNQYLGADERHDALRLVGALRRALELARAGERDSSALQAAMRAEFGSGARLRLDYAEIVDTQTLQPLPRLQDRALVAVAATVGTTRLIDNLVLEVRGEQVHEGALPDWLPGAPRRAEIPNGAGL